MYSQRGAVHKLITTLKPEVVAKWLGGSLTEAEFAVEEDWRSPLSFGYFHLPDLLNEGRFVSVPLLHIHQVKPYMYASEVIVGNASGSDRTASTTIPYSSRLSSASAEFSITESRFGTRVKMPRIFNSFT